MNDTSNSGVGINTGMESNSIENQINPSLEETITPVVPTSTVEPVIEQSVPVVEPVIEEPQVIEPIQPLEQQQVEPVNNILEQQVADVPVIEETSSLTTVQPVEQSQVEPVNNVLEQQVVDAPVIEETSSATPIQPVEQPQVVPANNILEQQVVDTPSVTPVEQPVLKEEIIEVNTTEQSSNGSGEDEKKSEEPLAKKKFPYAVVTILTILIILLLLYYFFWITPTRVFDKAINNSIDSVKNMIYGVQNSENDTVSLSIKTLLRTAGKDTKESPVIGKFDKLDVSADVEMDLKNFNIGANLYSKLDQTNKEDEKMKYPDPLNIFADYINSGIFLKLNDKSIKVETENGTENKLAINYERLNDAIFVFDDTKNRILDIIQNAQLNRTLTTKKINDQTTLAIKVNCDLDNDDIAEIYFKVFENYVENDEILTKLGNVFAMDKEEVRKTIQGYLEREVQTKFVNVNLYMNLANTELIGLDVTVENYYVEISYLNGYYYIDINVDNPDTGEDTLNIEVAYDSYYGVLKGIGTLENEETYLKVEFDYERKTKEGSTSMIGNTLNFKFYEGENEKPFSTLDCTLDLEFNKKIDLINPSDSVSLIDLGKEETTALEKVIKKIAYEYYFVYEKLMNNKKNILTDENKNEFENDANNKAIALYNELFKKSSSAAIGDIDNMSEKEKKELIKKLNAMDIKTKISSIESMEDTKLVGLLNILPIADQLTIVNEMTTAQIYALSNRITNKQFTAVFNKMSLTKKVKIISELTNEELKNTLGKISTKDQITLISKMNATQIEMLLSKIEEEYQLKIFNEMSVAQQIALLGKMNKDRVSTMFDKVSDSTKVAIVNSMTAAQFTNMIGKISEEQQLSVFNKMNTTQKITLLGKMTKAQVQSMIGKIDLSVQVTLANSMNATQLSGLLGKLTQAQALSIFNKMNTTQKITLLTKIPKDNLQAMISSISVDKQVELVNAMNASQLAKVIDKLTVTQQLTIFAKMNDSQKIQMLVNIPATNLRTMISSGKISISDQVKLFKGAIAYGYLDIVIIKPTVDQQKAIFNGMENADKIELLTKISAANLQKLFDNFTNTEIGGILQLLGSQSSAIQQAVIGKLTPAQQQKIQQIKTSLGI